MEFIFNRVDLNCVAGRPPDVPASRSNVPATLLESQKRHVPLALFWTPFPQGCRQFWAGRPSWNVKVEHKLIWEDTPLEELSRPTSRCAGFQVKCAGNLSSHLKKTCQLGLGKIALMDQKTKNIESTWENESGRWKKGWGLSLNTPTYNCYRMLKVVWPGTYSSAICTLYFHKNTSKYLGVPTYYLPTVGTLKLP